MENSINKSLARPLDAFFPGKTLCLAQQLTQGLINTTYKVAFIETNTAYILQRVNNTVFNDLEGIMQNIEQYQNATDQQPTLSLAFLKTTSGNYYFKDEKQDYWRTCTFVANSMAYNNAPNTTVAKEAGILIGSFLKNTHKIDLSQTKITLPNFHSLSRRINEFRHALQQSSAKRNEKSSQARSIIEAYAETLLTLEKSNLPLRFCHNDSKLNNLLFDAKTNKGVCMIDLDTLMPGFFFYDFGDAIRTVCNTAPENEKKLASIGFNEAYFRAFLAGFKPYAGLLTTEEKNSLATGCCYMPFIHGVRALADYLNNDRYYLVTYPDENLDRAMSLLTFAKITANHLPKLNQMVKEYLN